MGDLVAVTAPHLAWPARVEAGRFVTVEQDTEAEITQCVRVLFATRIGERVELPGFGVRDSTFAQTVDTLDLVAAVARWEPRASAEITEGFAAIGPLVREVLVTLTEVA